MYCKQNLSRFLDNVKHPFIGKHAGNIETNEDNPKTEAI